MLNRGSEDVGDPKADLAAGDGDVAARPNSVEGIFWHFLIVNATE